MTSFTKGPWEPIFSLLPKETEKILREAGEEIPDALQNDGARGVKSQDGKRIALIDCHAEYKRGEGYRAKCVIRDANAHLIAAAPEMYEALQGLSDSLLIPKTTEQTILRLLAKARGEEA